MTWLVTGNKGFIGSRLTQALPEYIGCDLKGKPECDAYLLPKSTECTHIAHLAANAGVEYCLSQPDKSFDNNVLPTQNILEIARRQRAHIAFASSAAVARPYTPYAAQKAACEALCTAYAASYGVPVSVFRLANVYGPGSALKTSVVAAMCKQALTGTIIVEGDGLQTRDFVYVDDVVAAILAEPVGIWSVRTGIQTSINQLAGLIAEMSGAGITYAEGRKNDARASYDTAEMFPLDYKKLTEGLQETWDWFKMKVGGQTDEDNPYPRDARGRFASPG